MMQRIGFLDGLRGLACMQVVLFHYGSAFCPNARLGVLANGVLAVAIFFVISGFVLTESFARAPGAIAGHDGSTNSLINHFKEYRATHRAATT